MGETESKTSPSSIFCYVSDKVARHFRLTNYLGSLGLTFAYPKKARRETEKH
jgi:hypothetical protein